MCCSRNSPSEPRGSNSQDRRSVWRPTYWAGSPRSRSEWRDLTGRFGPWRTVFECHRVWSADGVWGRLLRPV
ncbi:transposase [Streptomyces sp. NPDC018026]|uniref:transposase n=1 Tax=Streptomyces sp. NPDC018026 TaxID=3365031 RepID=UPI0037A697A3